MRYDHRIHAGNKGDVVKHVALVAALRTAMEANRRRSFRYADAFAGPSGTTLRRTGEWVRGIGSVDRGKRPRSRDVRSWLSWYLPRPILPGGRYPGSALIAADVAASLGKRLTMNLWDTSNEA